MPTVSAAAFARGPRARRVATWPARIAIAAACAALALLSLAGAREKRAFPALVFVAREPVAASTLVPGVGPAGRTYVGRGELVVREGDGRVRPLFERSPFVDVADPAVSYDGRRIAFAAVTKRDAPWRLWTCDASGEHLAPLTRDDRAIDLVAAYGADGAKRFARYDDFDPCWLPDGRIAFASTRWPMPPQQGSGVASNLWVVGADGSGLRRITAEHDGGEEPSVDPTSGRLVYARWFFNRFRAGIGANPIASGVTDEMPADTANVWMSGSIETDGDHLRLAGGDPSSREGEMGYQPLVLADTTFVGVVAERPTLLTASRLGIHTCAKLVSASRPLAGYGAERGWSACAPAALPDGRLVFSMDDDGTGRFDLFVADVEGRRIEKLVDAGGRLALDAAVLAPRPLPPTPPYGETWPDPADPLPHLTREAVLADERIVRFDCLNIFANGPVDSPIPDGLPIRRDVRILFYAALPRPGVAGGDSLAYLGEMPVSPIGRVAVDRTPSDQPLFEQLVDSTGHVLVSARGPAHVQGWNFTRPGAGTKCVGCHVGHSAIPVPASGALAEYVNVSPSATASASGTLEGNKGARNATDRRTRGDFDRVAWLVDASKDAWIRLEWPTALEGRAVVLYAVRDAKGTGCAVKVARGVLVLFEGHHEVRRIRVDRTLSIDGTRVELGNTRFDALEFHPERGAGKVRGRPVTGLAEIETIARLAWE